MNSRFGERIVRLCNCWSPLLMAIGILGGCTAFDGYPERPTKPSEDLTKLESEIDATAISKCLDPVTSATAAASAAAAPTATGSMTAADQLACRNRIVAARMYATDIRFSEFEEKLFQETRESAFGATMATLGLSTAGAVVSGGASQVLSGISALVIGGREAFQKEVLAERTVIAIHTAMRARRAEVALRLRTGMGQPIDQYPLALALADLNEYYNAGTILGALIGITETIGVQAANAEEELLAFTSLARTSEAVFLQGLLASAGRDAPRLKEIQDRIRAEMVKQGVPTDISVADFVRRPDPAFDRQRQEVAKALGWTP